MGIGVAGATDHHYVRELVLAALSDRDDVMDFEPVVSCTAADAAVAITPQHTLSEGRTTRLMPAPGRRDCRRWREQRDPEEILVLHFDCAARPRHHSHPSTCVAGGSGLCGPHAP
jgi:hypothetical protein